jgi:hypothetical protein
MAKICVVIDVPGRTIEELRQFVHDVESELDSTPVAAEYVEPIDIVGFVYNTVSKLGTGYSILYQSTEESA